VKKEDFKKYGYQLIDWVADYLEEVEKYPVKSTVRPGEIKNQLPASAPVQSEGMDHIL